MRVGLMATCLVDVMYPTVGQATVSLLERLGHKVVFPAAQTCCGQMHINTGYSRQALPLVRHHAEVFGDCDVVVAPSGSCVGSVRHQHEVVAADAGDAALAADVHALAARTYELCEFIVDVIGTEDVGAWYPHTVTYHPTCHSLRMLRVGDKPLRLLQNVEGLTLSPLKTSDQCCGFGGTFALKNSATSTAMLDDKIDDICGTGATVVTAGDSSCLMHIGGGLARADSRIRPIHIAEILASTRVSAR